MEKIITYFGKQCIVKCDGNCNKAWGIQNRPFVILDENNKDDFCYLTDDELDEAPIDPKSYEGDYGKPKNNEEKLNKWCVRQCERSNISEYDQLNKDIILSDFSKRIYNIPSKHKII